MDSLQLCVKAASGTAGPGAAMGAMRQGPPPESFTVPPHYRPADITVIHQHIR